MNKLFVYVISPGWGNMDTCKLFSHGFAGFKFFFSLTKKAIIFFKWDHAL